MLSFKIHQLTKVNGLEDFRLPCKFMSHKISVTKMRPGQFGRFPMRCINEKVRTGTVTAFELIQWYPRAVEMLRKGINR